MIIFLYFRQSSSKNMEFDFQDEVAESSTSTKFGTPGRTPKTLSAKKKTTFNQVLDKMKKSHATPK